MAETSVGTAKLNLTLDTSEYTVALERAKQQQSGLGQVAQEEAAKMTRAQRQVIQSFERQAAVVGLTNKEKLQYNILTRTSGEVQAALLGRVQANTRAIEQQGVALRKAGTEFNQYGISAKQTAAAMRGVPAQLTDIVVSLQGGQNPLTVLLQQGGQLKDMFGGIVPAARALGGAVAGLVNPYTIAAAAIGGMAFAYLSAEARANEFNQALILTGSTSRVSADDLNNMALQLDNLSGVTSRQAAAALTQVVASGKIAVSQYKLVTEAAVLMQDAVGKATEETVAEYAEIARDPVNAILKLNESEKFLTQSVYERIRALQDAGDIEGAAALATEARASSQIQRANEVVESLGLVSGAWHDIKNSTGEAWDEAVNYFGQLDKEAKEAAGTLGKLWNALKSGPTMPWAAQAALYPGTGAATGAGATAADPKVNSAVQKQLDALLAGNRSREERQKLEETQIVNLYKQLGISKEDQRVQAALATSQQRYKESLPKGRDGSGAARSLANASASASLQLIKNAEDQQRAEISNTTKLLQAQYTARLVSASDYYSKQRELFTRDAAAQEQSLAKQIDFLRSRNVGGKDSVNVTREITELETKLAKVRADNATQLAILGIQEQDFADKRKRAVDAYKEALATANEAARESANAQLARIILGQREADQQEKLAAITAKRAEEEKRLSREYAETQDFSVYQEKLAALQEYTDEQVRIVQDGYARMSEAEGDWLNGLQGGLAQWMEGAQNVAAQTNAITQKGLDSLTDAFVTFATTGKLQWKSLLADIGNEIVKFMAKQAVMQFIQMFASYYMGGNTGTAGDLYSADSFSYFAKGGVAAGPSISAHSGTVVDKPTYFANGGSVMGEAGPEGIFPLTRGSNGKLGVQASGGGRGDVYITIETNVNSDGSSTSTSQTAGEQAAMFKDFGDRMAMIAQQEITKSIMPNGQLWKAGVT